MNHIKIGSVKIPLNRFAVSATGVLGIKGTGKTWAAKGVVEQLLDYNVPVVIFDAIGVWRYLKTPGDHARARGYKVVVAGGEEPDLPLTAENAQEIVRAAMRANVSLVIDLYDAKLSKADWRRIVQTSFRTLLYENKKFGPRYIVLEEAAEYCPQKVVDGQTFAEVEKFARMGGNAQLGFMLINPRSQEISKSVLDLCDNLLLLRQRGNMAIDAVQKWMDKVSPDIADEITRTLPNMKKGDVWVWADDSDRPVATHTGMIRSFHPDRTLNTSAQPSKSPVATDQFVAKMRADLKSIVEEKEANDPAKLKQENAKLKAQIANFKPEKIKVEAEVIEKPILTPSQLKSLKIMSNRVDGIRVAMENIGPHLKELQEIHRHVEAILDRAIKTINVRPAFNSKLAPLVPVTPYKFENKGIAPKQPTEGNGELVKGARTILIAIVQNDGLTREELTVQVGYRRSSRDTYLQKLSQSGYIDQYGDLIRATDAGRAALGQWEQLPTGAELYMWHLNRLPNGEKRILEYVWKNQRASVDQISDATGYKRSSRDTYLQKLIGRRLVERNRGEVTASSKLYD